MRVMRLASVCVMVALAVTALVGGGTPAQAPQGPPAAAGRGGGLSRVPPLLLTAPAFEDTAVIPDRFTAKATGPAVSPELKWTQVPPGTKSFVLLMHDLDPVMSMSSKTDATHWLVWNIPATAVGLAEGTPNGQLPDGTRQVGYGANGYMAPGAPAGPYHHYTFELYALDTMVEVPMGTPQQALDTRNAVFTAMDGHVLTKGVLTARFHR